MTKFFIFSLSLVITTAMNAQTISPKVAAQKAASIFARQGTGQVTSSAKGANSIATPELVYTAEKDGVTCYYVFNNPQGGYAIIGGDEHATQILATSATGSFNYDEQPTPVKMFLDGYEKQIADASWTNGAVTSNPESVLTAAGEGVVAGRSNVAPLIQTSWGQSAPYFNQTPTVGGTHCVTGCIATATAQVLYYLKWPKVALDTPLSKTLTVTGGSSVTESTKFGPYNWDASQWKTKYNGTETDQAAVNVANLMRDCGILTEMTYGLTASSSKTLKLRTYFKSINMDASCTSFANVKDIAKWEEKIYNELIAKRPVIYAAVDATNGGHCFICDGYNATDNTFHFNWGWNGDCQDAYYSLRPTPNMNPGVWAFSSDHRIVFGIKPNTTVAAASTVTVSKGGSTSSKNGSGQAKKTGMMVTDAGNSTISFSSGDILHLDFGEDGISSGGEDGESLLFGVLLEKDDDALAPDGGDYLIPSSGEAYDMKNEDAIKSIDVIIEDLPAGTYAVTPIFWYDDDDDDDYAGDGEWEYVDLPDDINIPNITVITDDTTDAKAVQVKQNTSSLDGKYLIDNSVRIQKDSRQYHVNGEEIK